MLSERKAALFRDVRGAVVEIGPGVGANLKYLDPERVTALLLVEPNTFMHAELAAAASTAGLRSSLQISPALADALPLASASQDWVLCTLVLCSVSASSLRGVVREAHRVLRPGGRFVFLEHVVADPSKYPLRAVVQRIAMLTGLWSALGDGCELCRDTGGLLRSEATADWHLDIRDVAMPVPACATSFFGLAFSLLAGTQVQGTMLKLR